MEQTLGQEYFDNLKLAREGNEEALEALVQSKYFTAISIFRGVAWSQLRYHSGLTVTCAKDWYDLVRPALFLAIMEVSELEWEHLWDDTQIRFANVLYRYLMNHTRREVEVHVLDGSTLREEEGRKEEGWPEDGWTDSSGDELDNYVPDSMLAADNTEEQALARMTLEKIREYLDEEEWIILTADYGTNDDLAKSLGINNETLRKRRERIRKRVMILFE